MGKITIELVRKRSEHNEGEISTLEELALHQEKIIKIENLDKWCRHLKVLLLQNNSISKLENLSRLKCLEYLNLTLNNIEEIEGLHGCESLKKLDLTLNFIGKISSVSKLRKNEKLSQLYLTGNPCADFLNYRPFVITQLPQLAELDSVEIKNSERITSNQLALNPQFFMGLKSAESAHALKRAEEKNEALVDLDDEDFWNKKTKDTPENRLQMQLKIEEEEEKKNEGRSGRVDKKTNMKPRKFFHETTGRALNINEGKYPFELSEDGTKIRLNVKVPKFMDTSLIHVDVESSYVRIKIREKILQLCLEGEVRTECAQVQRSQITGHLLVTMDKIKEGEMLYFTKSKNESSAQLPIAKDEEEKGKYREEESIEKNSYSEKKIVTGTYLQNVNFDESEVPPLI